MRNLAALLLVIGLLLTSCDTGEKGNNATATADTTTPADSTAVPQQGITFREDEPINKELPPEFKTRVFYERDDILTYELNDVVGSILLCKIVTDDNSRKQECDLQYPGIVQDGVKPHVGTPDKVVYRSKIDQGATAEGTLLLVTGQLSAEQLAEITITDATYVYFTRAEIPTEELVSYRQANPNETPETQRRYWIKGIRLSTIVRKDYSKVASGIVGVVGPITSVKGSIYRESSEDSVNYKASLVLVDIDRSIRAPELTPSSNSSEPTPEAVLMALPEEDLVVGSINGLEQLPKRATE